MRSTANGQLGVNGVSAARLVTWDTGHACVIATTHLLQMEAEAAKVHMWNTRNVMDLLVPVSEN